MFKKLFARKKSSTNKTIEQTTQDHKGTPHISNLERFIQQAKDDDPRLAQAFLEGGYAYLYGHNHALVDKSKAKQYFLKAQKLGHVEATGALGYYYVFEDNGESFKGDGLKSFTLGLHLLKDAHLKGDKRATDLINETIRTGAYKFGDNVNNAEDFVNWLSDIQEDIQNDAQEEEEEESLDDFMSELAEAFKEE